MLRGIDADLWKRVKIKALQEADAVASKGETIKLIIERLLRKWVDE